MIIMFKVIVASLMFYIMI